MALASIRRGESTTFQRSARNARVTLRSYLRVTEDRLRVAQLIRRILDDITVTRLPHADHAIADTAKIRDYLLSRAHPVGRFKAAFFEALGYRAADWRRLERDLLYLCRSGVASGGQLSPFGSKYEVRGTLFGPSGRHADVVTVWVILTNEVFPRFVTAYPG